MRETGVNLFNPARLAFARRRRGLTKIDLAKRLGLDSRSVSAYEAGDRQPSADTLDLIEITLQFPRDFFFGDDLDEADAEIVSFRALTKMTARQRDMALMQGALGIHFSAWLERRFELPVCRVPDLCHETYPEAAAQHVRDAWTIGNLSIRNIVHLLEANGVRIFSLAVEAREVDAFSMWRDDKPFIFLNGFKTAEHARFDAAHELGHLVLHKHGGPRGRRAEIEANTFASAFLMPRASVLAHPPRVGTLSELIRLKKNWGTSVCAVNYRLHELGLLSDWNYHRLWREISKMGYRQSEPAGLPRETSQLIPKMLNGLYQESGMTRAAIAAELCISVRELESLMFMFVMAGLKGGRIEGGDAPFPTNRDRSPLRRVK